MQLTSQVSCGPTPSKLGGLGEIFSGNCRSPAADQHGPCWHHASCSRVLLHICPIPIEPLARAYPNLCHKPGMCQQSDKSQHHSKVTFTPGRKEDNHIHQFHCSPSSGLGANIWLDCRPHTPTKLLRRQHRGSDLHLHATASLENT